MNYNLVELKANLDPRGGLVSFQEGVNCPFAIKRCFYIFDTKDPDVIRGAHANRNSEFVLVVISGSCRVKIDDGKTKDEAILNRPFQALYLNKMVWKEMFEFSHNAVLLVLTNTLYDENEYIRDYDDFMKEVKSYEK